MWERDIVHVWVWDRDVWGEGEREIGRAFVWERIISSAALSPLFLLESLYCFLLTSDTYPLFLLYSSYTHPLLFLLFFLYFSSTLSLIRSQSILHSISPVERSTCPLKILKLSKADVDDSEVAAFMEVRTYFHCVAEDQRIRSNISYSVLNMWLK